MLWFTGENLGDQFKNEWKKKIKRKGDLRYKKFPKVGGMDNMKCVQGKSNFKKCGQRRSNTKKCGQGRSNFKTTTTLFVPASHGSKLFKFVQEAEMKAAERTSWKAKVVDHLPKNFPS